MLGEGKTAEQIPIDSCSRRVTRLLLEDYMYSMGNYAIYQVSTFYVVILAPSLIC
jgi:hypothetical protein